MIIETPFLHKFKGRSPNRSDIRDIVCFDRENFEISERSLSEFDEGSDLGNGIHTLSKDGDHWAYYGTSVTGCLDNRPLDSHGQQRAMASLSNMINTTRFFDEGRTPLKLNRLMSEPLPGRWIEDTQRERIVARFKGWIDENVAMIGEHLAIRVGEPSLRLTTTEPDDKGVCGLWIFRERLLPEFAAYGPGVHFPVDKSEEILQLTLEAIATNPLVDTYKVAMEAGVLSSMMINTDTVADMHERTLRSLATAAVVKGPRGKNGKALAPIFAQLDTLDDMPAGETDDAVLDEMMERLVSVSRNVLPTTSILIGMAAERWYDRPIVATQLHHRP